MDRFDDFPRLGSGVGYATFKRNAKGIEKAGGTDADALAEALRGLELDTPLGPIEMRAVDQQSTMGTFVGRLTVQDGMPRMVDWQYPDGREYLPSEDEYRKSVVVGQSVSVRVDPGGRRSLKKKKIQNRT